MLFKIVFVWSCYKYFCQCRFRLIDWWVKKKIFLEPSLTSSQIWNIYNKKSSRNQRWYLQQNMNWQQSSTGPSSLNLIKVNGLFYYNIVNAIIGRYTICVLGVRESGILQVQILSKHRVCFSSGASNIDHCSSGLTKTFCGCICNTSHKDTYLSVCGQ